MSSSSTEASTVAVDDFGSPEAFMAAVDATIKYFNDGDIVSGTVVKVDRDEVLLDIGYKTEGVIPSKELSIKHDVDPFDVVQGVSSSPRNAPSTSAPGARSRRSRKRTALSPVPSSRSSRAA